MMPRDPKVEAIHLKGVHQNNLKGFDLDIPLGKLTVVTGISGSGKSSLVFDTLHAEGQRRYVETFSPYTRQFLEIMDKPRVDEIHNIRPSIAIEQKNTVKTSRSTVGTMTELCDYFKIWFCHVSELFDPQTGEKIESDTPQSLWKKCFKKWKDDEVLLCFKIKKPDNLQWGEILEPLKNQSYNRCIVDGEILRLDSIDPKDFTKTFILIVQDRIELTKKNEARFVESAITALHYGNKEIHVLTASGEELGHFSEGLHSPKTGRHFNPSSPALFSFNSPIGACPKCRGFGRIIEIDYNLVIPDKSKSIDQGTIKPFHGEVFGESLKDLLRHAKHLKIRTHVPWKDLTEKEQDLVIKGEPEFHQNPEKWNKFWYGIDGFFSWIESKSYKMHMRFILSRYRSYIECPECHSSRLKPESLYWKWESYTIPDLYRLSIKDLLALMIKKTKKTGNHPVDLAANSIITRLNYLVQVGLGYLTLDRTSRTLSGGEVERVNLTTCLGTSLVDTLFVLDEPSVGLHSRDIGRLIDILRRLTNSGNTVVVVEHDEAIMRAADHIVELGPQAGMKGGNIVFSGPINKLLKSKSSLTGGYLSGTNDIALPLKRRSKVRKRQKYRLDFKGITKNNLQNLDISIPLKQFVCLSGVSGSGKSTLLNNGIHQGIEAYFERPVEDPAVIKKISSNLDIPKSVLVDQGPISKTPRSNPALYVSAWDTIRELFAKGLMGRAADMRPSHFSFNSGAGRCDHCQGLGYERVEMQFLADVYVTCPVCEGKRFKPEVLSIKWNHKSIDQILDMDIDDACEFFKHYPQVVSRLDVLREVGLGYLKLGQPLNTLSGGECQRIKLVKYLSKLSDSEGPMLLLLDEPTTGLHREDIKRLIKVLQKLVNRGHSLVIIEHQLDVLKSADWIIELGPDAGIDGGKIVAEGSPEQVARSNSPSAPYLKDALNPKKGKKLLKIKLNPLNKKVLKSDSVELIGAREHNLKNVSVSIPHKKITVVTGVSGSGKSSLAFDIIFAEGQRRFMESISAYARQFIEQMSRPDIDQLTGIAPTVAIEQRVTKGSRKSTVATVTEVAQYLRLLYTKVGIQHSPKNGLPLISLELSALTKNIENIIKKFKFTKELYLCTPLVRGRKGHHQPIADWAEAQGYELLRVDGKLIKVTNFKRLERFKEHDIELIITNTKSISSTRALQEHLQTALEIGKESCLLVDEDSKIISWFSTKRTDPTTGEAFPDLDPKHFSWNSPKGWCPTCHGLGRIYDETIKDNTDSIDQIIEASHSELCPDCKGARLNEVSRAVKVPLKGNKSISLPEVLELTPSKLMECIKNFDLDRRGEEIIKDLIPQIHERLQFMDQVGLEYLTLDRSSNTLSGGEAQRIRLAAQLSSNLSGVLYVLDEPSIGLHARDSLRLINSLKQLRNNGNTLLVVEHDEDTMRAADNIIDLGPAAGLHGGEVLATGDINEIIANKNSLTGKYLKKGIAHPLLGQYRELPKPWANHNSKNSDELALQPSWLVLREPTLRNLKGDSLFIPIGKFTIVCGISGAGKSTLIRDLLKPCTHFAINKNASVITGSDIKKSGIITTDFPKDNDIFFKDLINGNAFKKVIEVDQEPIGKTPRSTPATYIGAYDIIRDIYASLPESKMHGFTKSHYSFNTPHGRCEVCSGSGRIKLEMNFLPDTYVTCEACNGSRYGPELSEIRWNEKNIAQSLEMSFEEGVEFFKFHSHLKNLMQLMIDCGLGYLKLGQSSPTLSGGEAQRLKLVTELAKGLPTYKEMRRGVQPKNLYILEEPTIGLHLSDCERLINILHRLVDQGHTVVVIEHHLDLIAEADYIVEVGPEGGDKGGQILYQGPLQGILKSKKSQTAPFLKDKLT